MLAEQEAIKCMMKLHIHSPPHPVIQEIMELNWASTWTRLLFSILILFILLLSLLYIRWKRVYSTFNNLGIKGPTPQLYYGSALEIKEKGLLKFFKECDHKFGKVYGYFNGARRFLVVSDLEIMRQVTVKQFNIFMDRSPVPNILRSKGKFTARGLFNSGEFWARVRKILSKSFNTISMNRMAPLIEEPCISLCDKFKEFSKAPKSVDIYSLYSLYTMEVILSTGFGHKVNVIQGGEDELTDACASMLRASREGSELSFILQFLSNFPFMEWFIVDQSKFGQDYLTLERHAIHLLAKRMQNIENGHKVPQDLLQLLIDARADDDEIDIKDKKLNNAETVRLGISFLLAGYETTSNALGFTTYLLALHPEEQDKLYDEISTYYHYNPNATLVEVAQNVSYLDMILQESLRLYPPAPRINRYCSKTVTINGVTIPKGCTVEFPVYAIHHSSEHWSEPEEFRPNRFSKEEKEKRHSLAHIPFGMGPRSCIGMRLALMEAKMALVSIVYNYELIESPDTEKPLSLNLGITIAPQNGVWIRVKQRSSSKD